MYREIVCAGFGGQGIMVMGKLLAQAAMKEMKEITWMPSHGAEVRGGTAHSMVVISDSEIASASILEPDDCIIMNRPSFLKFEQLVKKGGLMIVNSSLVEDNPKRDDIKIVRIPATERAVELGDIRIANMIALGAYQKIAKVVSMEDLIKVLEITIPKHRHNLIPLNKKALKEGARLADVS